MTGNQFLTASDFLDAYNKLLHENIRLKEELSLQELKARNAEDRSSSMANKLNRLLYIEGLFLNIRKCCLGKFE